jgi:hypothetical protein
MTKTAVIAAALMLVAVGCAEAVYYVRPGAGAEEFRLDVAECQSRPRDPAADAEDAVRLCLRAKGWTEAVPSSVLMVPVNIASPNVRP